jgi:hypothetical protein
MDQMILDVSFTVYGRVKIDLARAMEDPWWEQSTTGLDLNDPIQLQQAISNYVSAYLRHEALLSDVPWSCGPADIYNTNIEVKNGGSNGQSPVPVV